MRRTYIKPGKSKTSSVKEEALMQLRQTRAKIKEDHPDLLGAMKEKILALQDAQSAPIETGTKEQVIDKQKNISTVMKFLETKPDNKAMDIAIKAMLAKHARE